MPAIFVPTLLDLIGIDAPASIAGVPQMPIEGVSFAPSIANAAAPSKPTAQYFEMFGHRGLWKDGWKAVSFHPSGTPFESDKWELFHLDRDFSETDDLAAKEPARLEAMVKQWWGEAEKHNVLPLDDRFAPRFVENAARFHGARNRFTFHAGMGHVPTDVAPDVRSRSYTIEAFVEIADGGRRGRADRAWRCDVRLQSLRQGRLAGARPQHRRQPQHRSAPTARCRRVRTGLASMSSGWCAPNRRPRVRAPASPNTHC